MGCAPGVARQRGGGGCGLGLGIGRRRGRVFDNGDLRLLIMALLAEKPRHGYEIIKALEQCVGQGYSPSPGVIYPTLTLLEELGHASVTEERAGRRLYALTEAGAADLEPNRPAVEAILSRLAAGPAHRGIPPQVLRAMEALAGSVRARVQARPLDAAGIEAVAAAIDAAARAIEDL
ncbi:PadR family transcriptional regulator [Rhodovastum atsumiense]|uniref:PadR family transcriptional regulator n=2 Tax=Rhodovastum atsumiense TaxID=504468 RepID=A0A5M6INV3_9PROT|nr:PadR family transcriptional regulator [Rhodovastum atsumiense]